MNENHPSIKFVPGKYISVTDTLPDKTKIERKFEFKKVSVKVATRIRLSNTPYCIMRLGNELYVAILPEEYFQKSLWLTSNHICDRCRFCRAMPTEKGGCNKVHDRLIESLTNLTSQKIQEILKENSDGVQSLKRYAHYVRDSKRLEKYPYITCGIETVHTGNDYFIVSDCANFLEDSPRVSKFVANTNTEKGPTQMKRIYSL